MTTTQSVFIDTLHRTSGSPATANFSLTTPLRVREWRLHSFSMYNTFHNIHSGNNTIELDTGVYSVTPGFYTSAEFVAALASVTGLGLTFSEPDAIISWPAGSAVQGGTMMSVLGLDPSLQYTGPFESRVFLATPQFVTIECPQLAPTASRHITLNGRTNSAILTIPVTAGYLNTNPWIPTQQHIVQIGGQSPTDLSQLDFRIVDAATGRLLTEARDWAMQIEIR